MCSHAGRFTQPSPRRPSVPILLARGSAPQSVTTPIVSLAPDSPQPLASAMGRAQPQSPFARRKQNRPKEERRAAKNEERRRTKRDSRDLRFGWPTGKLLALGRSPRRQGASFASPIYMYKHRINDANVVPHNPRLLLAPVGYKFEFDPRQLCVYEDASIVKKVTSGSQIKITMQ